MDEFIRMLLLQLLNQGQSQQGGMDLGPQFDPRLLGLAQPRTEGRDVTNVSMNERSFQDFLDELVMQSINLHLADRMYSRGPTLDDALAGMLWRMSWGEGAKRMQTWNRRGRGPGIDKFIQEKKNRQQER